MERDYKRMREIAHNLKRLRKGKQLSQEELSAKADLSYTFVNQIENCKRNMSAEAMFRICTALEVTPNELMNFSDTDSQTIQCIHSQQIASMLSELKEDDQKIVLTTMETLCHNLKNYSSNSRMK